MRDTSWWGAPVGRGRLAVVAVHGRDQDPETMRDVAERAGYADAASPITWLAPAASGRTWYPKRFTDPRAENEPDLTAALATVEDALAELATCGFPSDRVVLLGFSQGACLLADVLVRTPRRFAAAALLTGGYIGPPGFRPEVAGGLAGVPVLLATSSVDSWVPLKRVQETAEVLAGAGAHVDLRVDDDPVHQVNDATVGAVRALLADRL
ncbi:alpha/beta hydrolase [Pseudonocardia lutea]|uniref:Alpha/beta hydrolase n=1 Tax=Pseudonocardia lutea TaxID=2172015 RepID=A0ABW1HZT0_9PSEU